jgi:TolB protein
VLPLPVLALLVVGLVHGPTRHVTPVGSADGIALALAPKGTSHVFVTRGGELVQVTDGDGSDLAPAWSPDRRRIAFQSNRDGNWEIYVANADGSNLRRLTDDEARDGEPSWSPNGKRIAFARDGHLYEMRADGKGVHSLENDGEWPSWSPDGKSLAYDVEYAGFHGVVVESPVRSLHSYGRHEDRRPRWSPTGDLIAEECELRGHWHVCTLNVKSLVVRYLTGHDSDSFAPTWSPDGRRIAFISDRDGKDELFAMNSDGTGVVRLTSGQADKDTPAWGP